MTYHRGPETKEIAGIARKDVRFESARFFPVPEAFAIVIRSTPQCQNEGQKYDPYNNDDLNRRQPEFKFTEEFHAKVIDGNDGNPENCDENTGVDFVSWYPELEHKSACCELIRRDDDVLEPISAKVQLPDLTAECDL